MQKRSGKFSSTQSMRFTIIMLATSVLKSFTALACIIGLAVCCCLPSIIAILYAVPNQVKDVYTQDLYKSVTEQYNVLKSAIHEKQGLEASTAGISLSQP